MFEHHNELSKYWARTAAAHHAAGFHYLGALYQTYAEKHAAAALEYAE